MTAEKHEPDQSSMADLKKRIATLEVALQEKEAIELALRRKQAMLARTEHIAHVGSWEWEVATDTVTWSEELFHLYQMDPAAGAPPYAEHSKLYPPQDMARLSKAVETALNTGTPYKLELRAIRADGTVRECLAQGYAEIGSDGRVVRLFGLLQDITERKQTAETLHETRAILQAALDQSQAGIAIAEAPSGTLRYVNNAGLLIRGESRAAVVNGVGVDQYVASWQILDLDGIPLPTDAVPLARAVLYGEQCSREFIVRRADNDDRIVLANAAPVINEQGQVTAGVVVFLDITERKRVEEELNRSLERLALATRAARLGIWDWDIRKNKLVWDDRMYELYGVNRADFVGAYEAWLAGLHPDDVAVSDEISRQAQRGERDYDTEFRVVWPTGEVRVLKAYGQVVRDRAGHPVRMTGINYDITERRQVEAALREGEERQRIILESLADYVLILDADGRIEYINQTLPEFNRQEVIGTDWLMWLLDEDRAAAEQSVRQTLTTGEPTEIEYRVRAAGQNPGWYHVKFVRMAAPFAHKIVLIGTDITGRKRQEAELRESEQNYREIFNATSEAIFIHDALTGQILDVNDSMLRMYAFGSKEEVVASAAKETSANIPPYTEAEAYRRLRLAAGGQLQVFDWLARKKSGETFWVEVSLRRTRVGGRACILAVVRDISERKQAEAEQERLRAQLLQAQKMESVGQLAGGVAHDFNNMLMVILGRTEMALKRVPPGQPIQADLEEIHTAAQQSADLTRQLLAFARKQIIMPRVLDLNDTVAGLLKMLQRLIGETIELTWKPAATLWSVKMDPSQINQILVNLAVNARDAMAGGGNLLIETENTTLDAAYCARHADVLPGDYVLLAVSDTGVGMGQDTIEHLFEPFFTTKDVGEGTGLGLATIYGIVKQNNGHISVYSEPAQGTIFKIYLPRDLSQEARVQKEVAIPPQGGCETILLVEDEPSILEITQLMLTEIGYRVLTATTPDEALQVVKEYTGEIHLLMTDVVMPGMNGRDLAQRLLTQYPTIKQLFMSGYTADIIAPLGVVDQGVAFIQKPFSINHLSIKIREVLDGYSSTS